MYVVWIIELFAMIQYHFSSMCTVPSHPVNGTTLKDPPVPPFRCCSSTRICALWIVEKQSVKLLAKQSATLSAKQSAKLSAKQSAKPRCPLQQYLNNEKQARPSK